MMPRCICPDAFAYSLPERQWRPVAVAIIWKYLEVLPVDGALPVLTLFLI